MYKKIEATVRKSLPEKYANMEGDVIANLPLIIKKIVKTKVKNSLGGRLRAFIVGAAPLSPDVITSYKNLDIKSIQGYGLTECSPLVAGNNDFYINPDAVGLPIPNVSYKIDKPDSSGVGEILVKGPNVMLGYYENENATNESKIVTTSLIFLCFKPLAPILKAFFKGNLDLISLKLPFL